ncbi:unnamed protein product [Parajaminaea phylloscopi]
MRQKRSKTYRKLLASYILHFGYRPPFQLLVDASFALALSALHLSAEEADKRLSDVLQVSQMTKGKRKGAFEQPDMKCMITQCCMVELYKGEKEGQLQKDAVQLAKTWERRKCNHREAIDGDECLKSVVGPTNKHRYMVASNSRKVRNHLREEVAGVPVVHTNQSRVIVLEPPSEKTKQRIQELEVSKLGGNTGRSSSSMPLGDNVIVADGADGKVGDNAAATEKPTIVRGGNRPKAPNSLSNKKPKRVLEQERMEKEKRTKEVLERTEANRLKKRKAEEEEAHHQSGSKRSSSAAGASTGQEASERDPNTHSKKRRKRGGRGGSGAGARVEAKEGHDGQSSS